MPVRFLVDADLPRAVREVLSRAGHDTSDVRDIGFAAASDADVARLAPSERRVLITGDFDFADVRNYPPDRYAGNVVLTLRRSDTRASILSLVEALARRADLLTQMPGRLAIVDHAHVRLRPPLD